MAQVKKTRLSAFPEWRKCLQKKWQTDLQFYTSRLYFKWLMLTVSLKTLCVVQRSEIFSCCFLKAFYPSHINASWILLVFNMNGPLVVLTGPGFACTPFCCLSSFLKSSSPNVLTWLYNDLLEQHVIKKLKLTKYSAGRNWFSVEPEGDLREYDCHDAW